jgi:pSer/pThr/pTyr-binding forkhead associated (FHA) protein
VFVTEEDAGGVQHKFVTTTPPEVRLRVIDVSGRAKDLSIPVQGSLFVGRAEGNDLVFDDPRMSRQHFAIEVKDGIFSILNLSESSGTSVNGVGINAPRKLSKGDMIEAGNITLKVL